VVLKVAVPDEAVRGGVDEGYGPVADAFRRNSAERDEIGTACAVYGGRSGTPSCEPLTSSRSP
jgi:hypothetical protein